MKNPFKIIIFLYYNDIHMIWCGNFNGTKFFLYQK